TEQAGQTPLQKGEGPSSVPESSAGTPNTGTAHGSTTPPLRHGEGVVRRTGGEDEKARTVHTQLPPELLRNARELRKSMTDPEALLWQLLRNRRLNRWKFRRQHPMKEGYILDFYCAETRVAIELDGEYHKEALQKEYDEQRTVVLDQYGIRVIRFWNSEVLTNPEDVLRRIVEFSSLQNSSPQTPLQKGEGLPSVPESGAGTPNTGTAHGSTTPPLRHGEGVIRRIGGEDTPGYSSPRTPLQ